MPAASDIHEHPTEHWLDDMDPPEFLIALAGRHIQEMMNSVLRGHGLKLVEWRILDCLAAQENLTIFDLAERAVVDRTVASRLVDRLADRALVEKVALKTDRRFAQVSLTAKGRDVLKLTNPDVHQARARLFADMSPDEAAQLSRALEKLSINAAHKYLR
ncbi:MarR family winged helix-turn-helix transcriptional regulator [Sulfitobacter sp. MF3-043]|uniref:MarR family winged helix-turn-helix transcriptional regulator n=1 Tax=Sulfitobacter sediminivivens TaxID=3252902 RepID=UPI0036DECAFD